MAAERLSVRCFFGTRPISQIAPCSPETSDSKLSVKHTPAHSQFEYGSTKW